MPDPAYPSAAVPRERKLESQAAGFASHADGLRHEADQVRGRMTIPERARTAKHLRRAGRECVRAADLLEEGN